MNWLRYRMMNGTEKISDFVDPSCIRRPLTSSQRCNLSTAGISSGVTSHGPSGLNVSQDLPLSHWPPRSSWNSRSLTSCERRIRQ